MLHFWRCPAFGGSAVDLSVRFEREGGVKVGRVLLKGVITGAGLVLWTYFVAATVADAVCEIADLRMDMKYE